MFAQLIKTENIHFIIPGTQRAPEAYEKIYKDKKTNTEDPQAGLLESEWQLEYKLIYDSQKFENWNLE